MKHNDMPRSGLSTPFPPSRAYSATVDAGGTAVNFVAKIYKMPPALSPDTIETISVSKEYLQGVFSKYNVASSDSDISDMQLRVEFLINTVHANASIPKENPTSKISQAIDVLIQQLPIMLIDIDLFEEHSTSDTQKSRLNSLHNALKQYKEHTNLIRTLVSKDGKPINRKFVAWHDDALYISYSVKSIIEQRGVRASIASNRSACILIVRELLNFAFYERPQIAEKQIDRPLTADQVKQALIKHPHRALLGLT